MATPHVALARPDLSGNELAYVTEAIRSGHVSHVGRFERALEAAFAARVGLPCLATSSGTGALHCALLSMGVGHGDEVIVPDLTFGATASVVLAVGAKPIMVDISPDTWGLDYSKVPSYLTRRTRAIIPVHLYGEDAGDFKRTGYPVIEDACEALGVVPVRGEVACYSFYGNKPMTTGEGGMLCGALGNAKAWRDGGFDTDYRQTVPGLNYRMSNLQAAVGLAQIERLDDLLAPRARNIEHYGSRLKGRGKWLFVAECDPVATARRLADRGIESRPVFCPLHRSPAFAPYSRGKYKNADALWETHLCLPAGPHVTADDVDRICDIVSGG